MSFPIPIEPLPVDKIIEKPISEIEKIEKEILRARSEGRKFWYGMMVTKEVKDQIVLKFGGNKSYIIESKTCPRKFWEVIITILPE
jgi:hypothetical protein